MMKYEDVQSCAYCRFGTIYECRRRAPVMTAEGQAKYPSIGYEAGVHWCGEWEEDREKIEKKSFETYGAYGKAFPLLPWHGFWRRLWVMFCRRVVGD